MNIFPLIFRGMPFIRVNEKSSEEEFNPSEISENFVTFEDKMEQKKIEQKKQTLRERKKKKQHYEGPWREQ